MSAAEIIAAAATTTAAASETSTAEVTKKTKSVQHLYFFSKSSSSFREFAFWPNVILALIVFLSFGCPHPPSIPPSARNHVPGRTRLFAWVR